MGNYNYDTKNKLQTCVENATYQINIGYLDGDTKRKKKTTPLS